VSTTLTDSLSLDRVICTYCSMTIVAFRLVRHFSVSSSLTASSLNALAQRAFRRVCCKSDNEEA
jgi:hypothetical protein